MPTVEDLLQEAANRVASLSDDDIAVLRQCWRVHTLPLWKAVYMVLNTPPPDGIDIESSDVLNENSKRVFRIQHGFPDAGEDMLLVRQHLLDEMDPEIGPYPIHGLYNGDVNARQQFTREELKGWCAQYRYTPVGSCDASRDPITADMPFMNPEDPDYAPELAMAVITWLKLFRQGEYKEGLAMPKQVLRLNPELKKEAGACERIATVINPKQYKRGK